jgi:hypothetical protein
MRRGDNRHVVRRIQQCHPSAGGHRNAFVIGTLAGISALKLPTLFLKKSLTGDKYDLH